VVRRLFFAVAALVALYGGYWFAGARQVEHAAAAALAELRSRGWDVAYSGLDTTGFPSRFDTTVTELALVAPDGRTAWATPSLRLLALSYRPNRVTAVLPPGQELIVASLPLSLDAEGLRASAWVAPTPALTLREAMVESGPARLEGLAAPIALDRLRATMRAAGPAPGAHDLWLEVGGLRLGALAEPFDLRLDAQLLLDRPLDRRIETAPGVVALTLDTLRLSAGASAVAAAGRLEPDARGLAMGEIIVTLEGWEPLLDWLVETGLVRPDGAAFARLILQSGAREDGRVALPVTFAATGVSTLGLWLAPPLRLR
jgi:hypothetical protein